MRRASCTGLAVDADLQHLCLVLRLTRTLSAASCQLNPLVLHILWKYSFHCENFNAH